MNQDGLSLLILPPKNTSELAPFVKLMNTFFSPSPLGYEIWVLENDKSTGEIVSNLSKTYPVRLFTPDKKNENQTILNTLSTLNYNIITLLSNLETSSLKTITEMAGKIYAGEADFLVAQNPDQKFSSLNTLTLKGQKIDARSPVIVFKKEIAQRIHPDFKPAHFDLEFINFASDAGYKVGVYKTQNHNHSKNRHSFWQTFLSNLKLKFGKSHVIPFHPETAKIKGRGFHYQGREFIHHSDLKPHQSAFHRLSGVQMNVLLVLAAVVAALFVFDWHLATVNP